jgi:hypothetical protein
MPKIVMVQGLTVSDYLLPGLGVLSAWTRVHLMDLPGCSGSGEPPHELAVEEFAQAVADWLIHRRLSPVILAGHSSGTQVAATPRPGRRPYARSPIRSAPGPADRRDPVDGDDRQGDRSVGSACRCGYPGEDAGDRGSCWTFGGVDPIPRLSC